MLRILIVEDEEAIANLIYLNLKKEGIIALVHLTDSRGQTS